MVTIERKNEIDKRFEAVCKELAALSKEVGRNIIASASPTDDWSATIIEGEGDNSVHYTINMYHFWDKPLPYAAVTKDGVCDIHYEDYLAFLNWREAKDE